MDLFGPTGCAGLDRDKTAALEAFADELVAYALQCPRHPAALRELADHLEHWIRTEIAPDVEIDYGAPDPSAPPHQFASGLVVYTCCIGIGTLALEQLTWGDRHIAIGARSGPRLQGGARCILVGNDTDAPTPDAVGYVNIDNRLKFWRDTGEMDHA